MNVKTFTTSVATAALVGALGLAYAQTTSDPAAAAPASPSAERVTPPLAPVPAPMSSSTAPSDSATTSSPSPATDTSSRWLAEPMPQADRG
jgi:hypothetical protein